MTTSPNAEKAAVVSEVREKLAASDAALITEYRGMTVGSLAKLRRSLRTHGAEYKVYKNTLTHDPADIHRAREIATDIDPIPVGILYRNEEVPCYEDLRRFDALRTPAMVRTGLEAEFDKYELENAKGAQVKVIEGVNQPEGVVSYVYGGG